MLHSSTCNTADMYVYAQAVVVYLTGGHVPGYRRVPTSGGAIGSQGMGDLVHPAQQYLQYKATWQSAMGIVVYLA